MATCPKCLKSNELRQEWGCDGPAPEPYYTVRCWDCEGSRERGGEPCPSCDGQGEKWMDRCPSSFRDARMARAFESYFFAEKGILPERGGLDDQDAWLVAVWRCIRSERAEIEEAAHRALRKSAAKK